jgi:LysR family cys regulon transcriptional activator
VYAFIESFAPMLTRAVVEKTLSDAPDGEQYDI